MYTILDLQGNEIKVNDLNLAIADCKNAISFLEGKQKAYETDKNVIIFPKALKDWRYKLKQLEKFKN